jgi:hypothetical protein
LLGYMTGVLSHPEAESTEVPEEIKVRLVSPSPFFPAALTPFLTSLPPQRKHSALSRVRSVVDLLLLTWSVTSRLETAVSDDFDDRSSSQGHFAVRAKVRARRALERIYKAAPGEVLDDVVEYWGREVVGKVRARLFRVFFHITRLLSPFYRLPFLFPSVEANPLLFESGSRRRKLSLLDPSSPRSFSSSRSGDPVRQAQPETACSNEAQESFRCVRLFPFSQIFPNAYLSPSSSRCAGTMSSPLSSSRRMSVDWRGRWRFKCGVRCLPSLEKCSTTLPSTGLCSSLPFGSSPSSLPSSLAAGDDVPSHADASPPSPRKSLKRAHSKTADFVETYRRRSSASRTRRFSLPGGRRSRGVG